MSCVLLVGASGRISPNTAQSFSKCKEEWKRVWSPYYQAMKESKRVWSPTAKLWKRMKESLKSLYQAVEQNEWALEVHIPSCLEVVHITFSSNTGRSLSFWLRTLTNSSNVTVISSSSSFFKLKKILLFYINPLGIVFNIHTHFSHHPPCLFYKETSK